MLINDRIYGEVNITEPVLIELINSKPMQRLKQIHQHGISPYICEKPHVTRFEHSVGVMILLKKLNAELEEQIVGLLHDIAHTAFSHVVDFVFKNNEHDYHDRHQEKLVMQSEIPEILKKFGFDVKRMFNHEAFPLLERKAPDLCADRVDYTMRDCVAMYGWKKEREEYLKSLIVHNNEIIMNSKESAINLALDYMKADQDAWANPREVAIYQILAEAIKVALKENILAEEDLFGNDEHVFNILKNADNAAIKEKMAMINPNFAIKEDKDNYDFYTYTKVRFIDPKFLENGKIQRASEISEEVKKGIEHNKQKTGKGYYVKVVAW